MDRYELDQEFNLRIKHNFKQYVLLTSKGLRYSEDSVLERIYTLNGYKCHKTVKYGSYTSHIHVKFTDEYFAKEAMELLNAMNCGLTAALVDDMLRDWFIYEIKSCCGPPCTLTIVDIIGIPPFNINFLKSNILSSIFKDFGAPYMLPYTAAVNEPHVQVLFNSMTEALAACIAFGEWYYLEDKVDSFFYRVRINPSNKEENLIRNCGGVPSEAFKLDYFSNIKNEIRREKNSVTKEKGSKSNVSASKGTQKLSKRRRQPGLSAEPQKITPISHTPILYFPIIATSCYNAPVPTNNQFGVDMTAILNYQQTFTAQAVVETNNPILENVYESSSSKEILEMKEHSPSNVPNCSSRIPRSYGDFDNSKNMHIRRRQTRIFVRRT